MTIVYMLMGYVVLIVAIFLGVRHIDDIHNELTVTKEKLTQLQDSYKNTVEAYNDEIKELQDKSSKRKVIIRDIKKVVNNENNSCVESAIPDNLLKRLREYGE